MRAKKKGFFGPKIDPFEEVWAWLDGSDPTTLTIDENNNVTEWQDVEGNETFIPLGPGDLPYDAEEGSVYFATNCLYSSSGVTPDFKEVFFVVKRVGTSGNPYLLGGNGTRPFITDFDGVGTTYDFQLDAAYVTNGVIVKNTDALNEVQVVHAYFDSLGGNNPIFLGGRSNNVWRLQGYVYEAVFFDVFLEDEVRTAMYNYFKIKYPAITNI